MLGYLADGGMAEIFLGRETDGRPVVIKRIHPHLARQQNFVAMFVDEARIGSLVHHPNVIEVFELGQVRTDLFLVMEYLAGENASGMMRRLTARQERLPMALAAYIVAEACAGLHHAHELHDGAGNALHLVHRDISLSNLFVTYTGEVKVLDFGIATAAHRLSRTATGQVKGKFSYMSPEQCNGEALDARSDLFSLGVVLYELSTGRRLFKRATELMVLKAVTEQPIPRPTRELSDYPPELEAVCMKALSRDRDDRYGSALEMRDALLGVIAKLGATDDQGAALSDTMSQLFAERIAEKRQMLSHVRANTKLDSIPAGDVDESVEVPQMTEHSATLPQPAVKRRWPYAFAALALVAAGALAVYAFQLGRPAAPAPAPAPIAVQPAPPPPPPSAPAGIALKIDSLPSGARLALDGAEVGTTPFELRLDAARGVKLDLALDGYAPLHQEVAIDQDQNLLISLVATPKPDKRRPNKRVAKKRFD
ncbi:MAG: serine/threonine-protein kinase [Kofleriaceae bacterium]